MYKEQPKYTTYRSTACMLIVPVVRNSSLAFLVVQNAVSVCVGSLVTVIEPVTTLFFFSFLLFPVQAEGGQTFRPKLVVFEIICLSGA